MLRTLFVFSILVPGMVFAVARRYAALLLYLWFAFFRPQEWVWFDISSLRLSLVLAVILVVPSLATGILPNLTHPLSIGALLFLASALVAQISAINQAVGWQWLQFFAQLILVCLLAITLIRTPRDLMRVMAVAACSLGYYAAKGGLVSMIVGGARFGEGIGGAYNDNNSYAMVTIMIMPMLFALAQNADLTFEGLVPPAGIKWIRRGLYLAVPLCAYTVVSTFSRAGFLGLVAAVVTFAMLHPRRIQLGIVLVALSGLAFFVPLPHGYTERIATLQANQGDRPEEDASEGRLHFWIMAIQMAEQHPFGVGMRNFGFQFSSYDTLSGAYGENRDVHSSHFQVLAEQGYFGASVWVLQFGLAFFLLWRVRRRAWTPNLPPGMHTFMVSVSTALIVSMVGFLVAGSFVSSALNDLTWLTFALIAALDLMSTRLIAGAKQPDKGRPVAVPVRPVMRPALRG